MNTTKKYAERYHDISCGHRVSGHESKCAHLHGHNYRIHFICEAPLDALGRVLDFSAMKARLCMWLESEWDHRFLYWENDPIMTELLEKFPRLKPDSNDRELRDWNASVSSFVRLPFNPTAENMASYLIETVAPKVLQGTGVLCSRIEVWETRKCVGIAQLSMDGDRQLTVGT